MTAPVTRARCCQVVRRTDAPDVDVDSGDLPDVDVEPTG